MGGAAIGAKVGKGATGKAISAKGISTGLTESETRIMPKFVEMGSKCRRSVNDEFPTLFDKTLPMIDQTSSKMHRGMISRIHAV